MLPSPSSLSSSKAASQMPETSLTWEQHWCQRLDQAFDRLQGLIQAHVAVLQGVPAEAAALWGCSEDNEHDLIEQHAHHRAQSGQPMKPLPVLIRDQPVWCQAYEKAYRRAELKRYPANTPFVVRRASGGHALGAWHPSGTWIYAWYVDESDVNAPDHYGFTLSQNLASRISVKRLHNEWYELNPARFVPHAVWDNAEDNGLDGIAATLNVPANDLAHWCAHACWEPVPLSLSWQYLADFNGFVGYQPEWSDHLEEALVFTAADRLNEDPDAQMAQAVGEFVAVQCDASGRPLASCCASSIP
jgi:hypothetical protein